MPKKKHSSNSSLGKSLLNKASAVKQAKVAPSQEGYKVHTTDLIANEAKPKLTSILEQNSLDEFVNLAEMSNKKFEALRRGEAVIVNSNEVIGGLEGQERIGIMNKFLQDANILNPSYTALKIPRRPAWNKDMTALEIANQENLAFLEWRRDIAQMEENNVKMAITPFEKNIEVWKQLWRVIEKSDILLQIVDARNPYFFYSGDLEKYIQEHGGKKEFILCINKADYLSQELIEHWNKYFNDKGVHHIFFSALKEQERLDKEEQDDYDSESDEFAVEKEEEKEFEPMFDDLKKKIDIENELKEGKPEEDDSKKQDQKTDEDIKFNSSQVFSRDQMLKVLQLKVKQFGKNYQDRLMVGTVGYPNVGKSSLINVLCGTKRVGVAAMPGKTKHFQTLLLENEARDLCLVDCPGLVFPSFANSKAEMYCCGVLPIQNIREYMSPVSLVVSRVPKLVLEAFYKIKMPERNHKKYTTTTFLTLFALQKGWITGGSSNPDIAVAAKRVLVDYTTGAIVFCHVRPDFDRNIHKSIRQSGFDMDLQTAVALPSDAQNYETIPEEDEQEEKIDVITDNIAKEQLVDDGTGKNLGIDEVDFDQQFFSKHMSQEQLTKLKLNKGEKRALKFLLKKSGELEAGQQIDLKKLTKTGDLQELKNLLALENKRQNDKFNQGREHKNKDYIETGGGHKSKNHGKRRGIGNNSNKMWDFKDLIQDDSD